MFNRSKVETNDHQISAPICFLREPEILARLGVTGITLRRWEKEGKFPRRRKIGKQCIAWVETEFEEWCARRVAHVPLADEVQ